MKNAKHILQSKTLWVSLATVMTGIGMFVSGEQEMQELALTLLGVVFTILRLVTDKPLTLTK